MKNIEEFKKIVWNHYKKHGRDLPWRPPTQMLRRTSPLSNVWAYKILVSEIMLQQTQVARVLPKYNVFLKKFPTFKKLADTPTGDVVRAWQGLGYNRRALALKRAAEVVNTKHGGLLPSTTQELIDLPGIGPYTVGALQAFVWNKPVVIIETNIRSVFIHHFFPRSKKVADEKLLSLIKKTVDIKNPREWYYALMDYGSYLKRTVGNANTKSKQYTKQSKFEGSQRQLRGAVLRALSKKPYTLKSLSKETARSEKKVTSVLLDLKKEGFVQQKRNIVSLI